MNNLRATWQQAIDELHSNRRLQWMLLTAMLIIYSSIVAALSNRVLEMWSATVQVLNLSARLDAISERTIDAKRVQQLEAEVNQTISMLPIATSSSVAEAQALKEVEAFVSPLISKKRLTLLGVEPLETPNDLLWQVRVQVSGRMVNSNFISLLAELEASHSSRRLNAFTYNPHSSNSLNFVVDFLFVESKSE